MNGNGNADNLLQISSLQNSEEMEELKNDSYQISIMKASLVKSELNDFMVGEVQLNEK